MTANNNEAPQNGQVSEDISQKLEADKPKYREMDDLKTKKSIDTLGSHITNRHFDNACKTISGYGRAGLVLVYAAVGTGVILLSTLGIGGIISHYNLKDNKRIEAQYKENVANLRTQLGNQYQGTIDSLTREIASGLYSSDSCADSSSAVSQYNRLKQRVAFATAQKDSAYNCAKANGYIKIAPRNKKVSGGAPSGAPVDEADQDDAIIKKALGIQ